jgi:hypothetical protein
MPPVGFEPTTAVFERSKTVHDLDREAAVICYFQAYPYKNEPSLRDSIYAIFCTSHKTYLWFR